MSPTRFELRLSAAMALGLALSMPPALLAQNPSPSNAPLSSGSGAGTGTGESTNLGTSGNRVRMQGIVPRLPQNRGAGGSPSLGPGAGTTFPGDPSVVPFATETMQSAGANDQQISVTLRQFDLARKIDSPGDRSLALQRIANAAIFSGQLPMSHQALVEAGEAALREPVELIRDQRLISIVTSLNNLAEADLREGKADLALAETGSTDQPIPSVDRLGLIGRAQDEWRRAAFLAGRITSYTYRSEMLYRVVDNEAYGSQTIVNEFPRDTDKHDDQSKSKSSIDDRADQILVEAAGVTKGIGRPVWRDRALVSLAYAAAQSKQFTRGIEMARMIPQPEVRTDALLKIAEIQARRDQGRGATETYREAAQAVASIPVSDVRVVLTGVLIDNLISVGRFEDARSTVNLYPDQDRRMVALGAVAESQGRRGSAASAMEWIAREVPSSYQPALYRRVSNGVLTAIEANRSRDMSNRDR